MSVINTNINSIKINNALAKNQTEMTMTMESLSTGSRVNRSSDDAAGIAIKENMTAQINGFNAAIRNSNDAISMLQTTDGALSETTSMLQRMRELSVLSLNDTYSTAQKTALSTEFAALRDQIGSIATTTQWNGISPISAGSTFNFQIGANAGDSLSVIVSGQTLAILGLSGLTIDSYANAASAMSFVALALSSINTTRSTIGAAINRLNYVIDNLSTGAQNAYESRSKIADTDYAVATSNLARQQIINQAGTAMLAQANQMPSMVLALLK